MTPDPLARLVAHDEIRQLAAQYAVAVDARDLDTLVSLFVTDVRVGKERSGHAALLEDFRHSLSAVGVTILNVGTQTIDLVDEDHATGVVYCAGQIQDGDRWIHQAIVYQDTYRREDGQWRFVRRKHELFHGLVAPTNPRAQPPADWPTSSHGVGTAPESFATWSQFWADQAWDPMQGDRTARDRRSTEIDRQLDRGYGEVPESAATTDALSDASIEGLRAGDLDR